MEAIRINEFVKEGSIFIKSKELEKFQNMKVEVIIIPLEEVKSERNRLRFNTYKCGGAVAEFNREDIYNEKL